jgi:hypothetical protein
MLALNDLLVQAQGQKRPDEPPRTGAALWMPEQQAVPAGRFSSRCGKPDLRLSYQPKPVTQRDVNSSAVFQ